MHEVVAPTPCRMTGVTLHGGVSLGGVRLEKLEILLGGEHPPRHVLEPQLPGRLLEDALALLLDERAERARALPLFLLLECECECECECVSVCESVCVHERESVCEGEI